MNPYNSTHNVISINNDLQKMLENNKDLEKRVYVLEQRVPVNVQMTYFKHSERLRMDSPWVLSADEEQVEAWCDQLLAMEPVENSAHNQVEKRNLLSMLANSRSVKAFRFLENYVNQVDPGVADWASMALMESQMLLEAELSEEQRIYVSTVMGGKGHKMRFCVVLYADNAIPFLPYQCKVIEEEIPFHLNKVEGELERLEVKPLYAKLICLLPIRVDIRQLFADVIRVCNECGNFLQEGYTIANTQEYTEEEILKEIEKNRK